MRGLSNGSTASYRTRGAASPPSHALHGEAEAPAEGVEEPELERAARRRLERPVGPDGRRRLVDRRLELLRRGRIEPEQRRDLPLGERRERALDGLARDVLARDALAVADGAVVEHERA